jgi:hypothetical protein
VNQGTGTNRLAVVMANGVTTMTQGVITGIGISASAKPNRHATQTTTVNQDTGTNRLAVVMANGVTTMTQGVITGIGISASANGTLETLYGMEHWRVL